jgi:hypothetical protein
VRGLAVAALEELRGERQVEFLDRLTAEHANIRAALSYGIASKDAPLALAIAGSDFGEAAAALSLSESAYALALELDDPRSCLGLHTSAHSHACGRRRA